MLGEVEALGLRLVEQGREDALALDERRVSQIEAVEVEQVEGEVDHALLVPGGEFGLQRVEVGNARLALHNHLAVENELGERCVQPLVSFEWFLEKRNVEEDRDRANGHQDGG